MSPRKAASVVRVGGAWPDLIEAVGVLAASRETEVDDLILALRHGGVVAEQAAFALYRTTGTPLPRDRAKLSVSQASWIRRINALRKKAQPRNGKAGRREDRGITRQLLHALSENERLVVTLYYYERLSFADIAAVLSISESATRRLHERAISTIRSKLTAGSDAIGRLLTDVVA